MSPDEPNGAAPEEPKGLREIAEAAYDDVVEQAEQDDADETDSTPQARDERGRWVAKTPQPGEAAAAPPSPGEVTQEPAQPHPAQPVAQPPVGQAAQAPANWSAEDRANFDKLKPDSWEREFLLRRHSEMEGDYQKRVQATAFSNQFVNAVQPVFNDPDIVASLKANNQTPEHLVLQWGAFHKRAVSQDDGTRIQLLFELADRMQLDPAAVFGQLQSHLAAAPPTFTPEELANPAIKKFADHIGFLNRQLQTFGSELEQRQAREREALIGAKRVEIDAFADAKDANGQPLRPYFNALLPVIMENYRSDPTKSIEDCYNAAIAPILEPMQAAAKASVEQQQNLARAQAVTRSNVRGMTAPVGKPPTPAGPRGLRQTMEEAAQEIGFDG